MINYLEYLDLPVSIGLVIIACFAAMQIIGEILEFKGKVVPEFFKIRKFFQRMKQKKLEVQETIQD